MAGRVLLVCALCVLCCCGGVGAWGGGYCTESDWRDLRAVARDMTEAEIEGQYCGRKPEFVQRLRASLQASGDHSESHTEQGDSINERGSDTPTGPKGDSGGGVSTDQINDRSESRNEGEAGKPNSTEVQGNLGKASPSPPSPQVPGAPPEQNEQDRTAGLQEDINARKTPEERAGASPTSQPNDPSQPQTRAQEPQNGVDATKQLSSSDAEAPPGFSSDTSVGNNAERTPPPISETGDDAPGTQAEDSADKNSKGKTASDSPVSPQGQQDVATAGAKTSGDKEPAAAAEGAVTNKNNSAITADSDGGSAASHCTSPVALFLLLACAVSAAMAAA
ncbi:hypothetical protein TraAM80_08051 [Trypanosoma rangeli]|uniref:Mucin-associated surface protein (MASP) n=1 Tax=Trypanosoma rangeli TaxID=5698 RepID=A0A3R7NB01_TRYRA|nr:uncharacterized protein TraAM80_08051 [Trypanosoma rangeli]RNE99758.1 hypothetical protein TraAM80_08051 [Trypanosoma rangeli]|eukprot:RNE99758.1 hypothetical protein TraAM80_08051 [Trypanosoma rangeli]